MGRSKRYETVAEKQRAYRERKKIEIHHTDHVTVENPKQKKLEELRELMKEGIAIPVEESIKPVVFRNDYGAVISEREWNQLQEKKRRAQEGGYILDEYSQ